ncbi:hypothetical protein SAMN04488128_105107 [Chitinophaga eiseniae]|uniref:Uncharacterized protein n=1 Tax=Chitinophaga eiseniae TaxID=634771 RepID=A0A1T4THW3_9BACT|nr:hypothetical protein [Chitinophaga eiseniae]SKA40043.1 hypothetical protein SAMN04488128_105107 [Chitinophaga eiseniae]
MKEVERIFIEKAVERAGIFLYSREIALEFVKACGNENIHLFGIDGFFLKDNRIQPSMTDSIDFSSLFFEGDIYQKAINFLEVRSDNMFFEITCA